MSDVALLQIILSLYEQIVPAHLFKRFVHYQLTSSL